MGDKYITQKSNIQALAGETRKSEPGGLKYYHVSRLARERGWRSAGAVNPPGGGGFAHYQTILNADTRLKAPSLKEAEAFLQDT